MTIKDRLDRARQLEYVPVPDFALLTGISERTIWRRLKAGLFPRVLHSGRITTIHRASALRVMLRDGG